jgi:hypothetical protein
MKSWKVLAQKRFDDKLKGDGTACKNKSNLYKGLEAVGKILAYDEENRIHCESHGKSGPNKKCRYCIQVGCPSNYKLKQRERKKAFSIKAVKQELEKKLEALKKKGLEDSNQDSDHYHTTN